MEEDAAEDAEEDADEDDAEEEDVEVDSVVENEPVPEADAEEDVDEEDEDEDEDEEVDAVMLNWFCTRDIYISIYPFHFSLGGLEQSTYRLSIDLLGLSAVGQVDGEGVASGELAAIDLRGAVAGGDVRGEQDGRGRVAGHVGQVDVEGVLVAVDRGPSDCLRVADGPDVALGRRGDLQGNGARGEGEESQGGDHLECLDRLIGL